MNSNWPFDRRDGLLTIGFVWLVYGAWAIYPPAGFIVGGVLLLTYWAVPYLWRTR